MKDPPSLRALVAWQSLPGIGPRTLAALQQQARADFSTLAALWETPDPELGRPGRLRAPALAARRDRRGELEARASLLAAQALEWGIEALTPDDPAYPAALRDDCRDWPVLYAHGAVDLLEQPLVAVVSSRSVGPEGLEWMDRMADALAQQDAALVTSIHRSAYQATATAAKRHGGAAVMTVDRGLLAAFPAGLGREPVPTARVWDEMLDTSTQLVVSPFGLDDGWTPGAGPRRDALVLALASAIVVVDVRPGGNIERGCRLAAGRGAPVFALDRGERTPPGTRELWTSAAEVERLAAGGRGDPGRLAAQVCSRLPLDGRVAEREQEGWRRETDRFLLSLACMVAAATQPRSVRVTPASGRVAQLLRGSVLARGLGRDERAPVDLCVASLPSPAPMSAMASHVHGGGWLVAHVAAADAAAAVPGGGETGAAGRDRLHAVIEVPGPPRGGAPSVVLLVGPPRGASASVQLLNPRAPVPNRHALRRFLTGALALISQRFSDRGGRPPLAAGGPGS